VTTTATQVSVNLDRKGIAAYLKVCLQTVDMLVRTQAFPSFKIGGKRLARLEDVEAYNDSLAQQAKAKA